MTTREQIELALQTIFAGHERWQYECFKCILERPKGVSIELQLGIVLVMMGVPYGKHDTFKLYEGSYPSSLGFALNRRFCGKEEVGVGDGHDPDWQRFIDEVVSIVDNKGS